MNRRRSRIEMEAFQIQLLRLYFYWKSGLQFKSHIRVIDKEPKNTSTRINVSERLWKNFCSGLFTGPQNKINQSAAFDAERCRSIPRHDRESGPYRSGSHISHWLFTLLVKKALKGFGAKIYFWSAASFINIQIPSNQAGRSRFAVLGVRSETREKPHLVFIQRAAGSAAPLRPFKLLTEDGVVFRGLKFNAAPCKAL